MCVRALLTQKENVPPISLLVQIAHSLQTDTVVCSPCVFTFSQFQTVYSFFTGTFYAQIQLVSRTLITQVNLIGELWVSPKFLKPNYVDNQTLLLPFYSVTVFNTQLQLLASQLWFGLFPTCLDCKKDVEWGIGCCKEKT